MSQQLSLFNVSISEPLSIRELSQQIGRMFDRNPDLQNVRVLGEISNYKHATSGHLYFTLKDDEAQLKAVMWKNAAQQIGFRPQNGDLVLAQGRVAVYAAQGTYQLYVEVLEPAGVGNLHQQFELLKAKLAAEGLFDSERKRPIPLYPRRIGIVSSPDAAGFQDMLNILARRFPSVEVVLSPTLVQGQAAPPRIVAALQALQRQAEIDVIIIARGGGSLEDLWCFNDERVVRAVANSPIPVITGVGHEIDFTLVDFAADLRAPTPSAAAEIATPDRAELLLLLQDSAFRLRQQSELRLRQAQNELISLNRTLRLLSPIHKIAQLRQTLDDQAQAMSMKLHQHLQQAEQNLALLESRLTSANPQAILERGYAIVTRAEDGKRITASTDAQQGQDLKIQVSKGYFLANITDSHD